jgi:hypothetical protein
MSEQTPLGRALRRVSAKGPGRLSSLEVPVLDDAADEIDSLTAELTTFRAEHVRLQEENERLRRHAIADDVALCTARNEVARLQEALREIVDNAVGPTCGTCRHVRNVSTDPHCCHPSEAHPLHWQPLGCDPADFGCILYQPQDPTGDAHG